MREFLLRLFELTDGGLWPLIFVVAGFVAVAGLGSIVSRRTSKHLTKLDKVLLAIALPVSFVGVTKLILAGGIYPNLSSERIARGFVGDLCDGTALRKKDYDWGMLVAPDYQAHFLEQWGKRLAQFPSLGFPEYGEGYGHREDPLLDTTDAAEVLELNSSRYQAGLPDTSIITLLAPDYGEWKTLEGKPLYKRWVFLVKLEKVPLQSRFLGPYSRWRVTRLAVSLED